MHSSLHDYMLGDDFSYLLSGVTSFWNFLAEWRRVFWTPDLPCPFLAEETSTLPWWAYKFIVSSWRSGHDPSTYVCEVLDGQAGKRGCNERFVCGSIANVLRGRDNQFVRPFTFIIALK